MSTQKTTSYPFEIKTQTQYVNSESKPEQSYHFFAYKIFIKNASPVPAQLISRHWIITDAQGHIEEVKGPGVVGQQPKIQPGQTFEYESACPLNSAFGTMKGFYTMSTDQGETFTIDVPEFYLIAPSALH